MQHPIAGNTLGHTLCGAVLALGLCATSAHAPNPEGGDVAPPPRPRPAVRVRADEAAPTSRREVGDVVVERAVDPRFSDHETVVGHFGIGFFGTLSLPIMGCGTGAACAIDAAAVVPAPTIGARYWMRDWLGVEGALGFFFLDQGNPASDVSQFGIAFHAGLPLALLYSGHFTFELVPQLNLGFASGSHQSTAAGGVTTDTSGFLFEIGAKTGAEIHFGFIGIPQLSLQGTLGLMIRHESRSADPEGPAPAINQHATSIATGVDGPPWAIFTGALTAIYYY